METIFTTLDIRRSQVQWEDYLWSQTPVEEVDGILYKREDKFAPLGYGGINGSKLRQCIYLFNEYRKSTNATGIISGASVKSPQLSMGTAVALHYGLSSIHVIGGGRHTSLRHENVAIAARLGAQFVLNKVAYNPALQHRVRELLETDYLDHFYLHYGISLGADATNREVEAFHRVGAEQVRSLPPVDDLVIPAGSCNSAISILYGVALFPQPIKNIYLIGIGPQKIDFMESRLAQIQKDTGLEIRSLFHRQFWHHQEKAIHYNGGDLNGPYTLHHYDLHKTGFTTYQEEVPWCEGSIVFHPTYEGKVMKYLNEKLPHLLKSSTCVWIVGSTPSWEGMYRHISSEYLAEPVLEVVR